MTSSMPGRWTFTTTGSPVRSRARYVWPIEAAARRFPVELREHLVDRLSQLGLEDGPDPLDHFGSDTVLELGQLGGQLG